MRAVLDSNVIVSGFLAAKGPSARVLDAVREGQLTWVTSKVILDEVRKVLALPRIQKRYRVTPEAAETLLLLVGESALRIRGVVQVVGKCRDPKDDAILACAVEGRAEYVVTGDEDLLTMEVYESVMIVTPRRFVEILQEETTKS